MLSRADAELARRDEGLPGLAILLDPDALVTALRSGLPHANLGAAQLTYIRYKPGMNCLVAYRLDAAGTTLDVYAKAYGPDASVELRRAPDRRRGADPLGAGRILLPEHGIVVCVFPNDDKLKVLTRLDDSDARQRLLAGVLPRHPELWTGTLRTLRYKPERRYVARLRSANGSSAVLKCYTQPGYRVAARNAKPMQSLASLRIAKRLGVSARHGVVALEWLPGRLLWDEVRAPNPTVESIAAVGAALAEFHGQRAMKLAHRTRESEGTHLRSMATMLGGLCPHLARQANALVRRLVTRLGGVGGATCSIHGDFYDKQVLLTDDRVAFLDLDHAARGDPMADLGRFVAQLEHDSVLEELPRSRTTHVADALLAGYQAATRQPLAEQLTWYTAAGLVHLAPEPFRNHQPDWPDRIAAILERAEAVLGGRRTPSSRLKKAVPASTELGRRGSTGRFQPTARGRRQEASGKQQRAAGVSVLDSHNAGSDPLMPFLVRALDPVEVQRRVVPLLSSRIVGAGRGELREIRVVRHKPGRRCLIEYDIQVDRPGARSETITLLGKARARGLDERTYRLVTALWESGFGPDRDDEIAVPEPVGVIPAFHLWLQRKVPGTTATHLLMNAHGIVLAKRIAEAIHKVHNTEIPTRRGHTMADELRILHDRLRWLAARKPHWAARLDAILAACQRLGASVGEPRRCGIHRDFFPDQVMVDGSRLYLLDFDLYCAGDPALDIGNFVGHLTEQSLRTRGNPAALEDRAAALEERFLELTDGTSRAAIRVYAILTLVRHIYISTRFADRCSLTGTLLETCEERLGVPSGSPRPLMPAQQRRIERCAE